MTRKLPRGCLALALLTACSAGNPAEPQATESAASIPKAIFATNRDSLVEGFRLFADETDLYMLTNADGATSISRAALDPIQKLQPLIQWPTLTLNRVIGATGGELIVRSGAQRPLGLFAFDPAAPRFESLTDEPDRTVSSFENGFLVGSYLWYQVNTTDNTWAVYNGLSVSGAAPPAYVTTGYAVALAACGERAFNPVSMGMFGQKAYFTVECDNEKSAIISKDVNSDEADFDPVRQVDLPMARDIHVDEANIFFIAGRTGDAYLYAVPRQAPDARPVRLASADNLKAYDFYYGPRHICRITNDERLLCIPKPSIPESQGEVTRPTDTVVEDKAASHADAVSTYGGEEPVDCTSDFPLLDDAIETALVTESAVYWVRRGTRVLRSVIRGKFRYQYVVYRQELR